jgi:hypothetical protein
MGDGSEAGHKDADPRAIQSREAAEIEQDVLLAFFRHLAKRAPKGAQIFTVRKFAGKADNPHAIHLSNLELCHRKPPGDFQPLWLTAQVIPIGA